MSTSDEELKRLLRSVAPVDVSDRTSPASIEHDNGTLYEPFEVDCLTRFAGGEAQTLTALNDLSMACKQQDTHALLTGDLRKSLKVCE